MMSQGDIINEGVTGRETYEGIVLALRCDFPSVVTPDDVSVVSPRDNSAVTQAAPTQSMQPLCLYCLHWRPVTVVLKRRTNSTDHILPCQLEKGGQAQKSGAGFYVHLCHSGFPLQRSEGTTATREPQRAQQPVPAALRAL